MYFAKIRDLTNESGDSVRSVSGGFGVRSFFDSALSKYQIMSCRLIVRAVNRAI